MKLWNKLMELHCSRYLGYPLEIVSIDKNHNIIDTITYTLGENMDVFRSLGEKLQWEVVETKYFFCDLTITIKKESKEMKEYTIEEALELLIRGYSKSKQGLLTVEDQKMIANIKSDIADLKGVDWSKVKVDTKILVRENKQEDWAKRYFAKYENERVYAWSSGGTSWSTCDKVVHDWKYAKLAEGEEND